MDKNNDPSKADASAKDSAKPAENNADSESSSLPKHGPKALEFPVVGIGASAGGLEAFKSFFTAMPPDSGMAFVLVQHLDPTHESMMTELLAKQTEMAVQEIVDNTVIQPNTVYMIPPNKYLSVRERRLRLSDPIERRGMRLPIDFFFRSMAEEFGDRAICIVLSGTGSDGTLGCRAVKGEGGMLLVQTPASAQYDGMPQNAIRSGLVDFVLPTEAMPKALLSIVHHEQWIATADSEPQPDAKPDDLQSILSLLRARTNHDFRCYKKGTLMRRVHRRMVLSQCDSLGDYLHLLRADQEEVKALLRDLLIGVTAFFRDPEAWEVLEKEVLAKVLASRVGDTQFRAWVPGCCTGEEAYSLAMLVTEIKEQLGIGFDVQIFASDIDESALETARAGLYPDSIAADVSAERLLKFFDREADNYRAKKNIRDMVVFANQNLVSDPPFSKLNLISCRNLLIYLDSSIQKQLITLMHFALKESGFLFLGPSESISQQDQLFKTVSKKWRIYHRIGISQALVTDFPSMSGLYELRSRLRTAGIPREPRPGSITALAHEILLNEYVPAAVIVTNRSEAVYYHGPVSRFITQPAGEPTNDITEMAHDGLRVKLRNALHACIREKTAAEVIARNERNSQSPLVTIKVRPLTSPRSAEGLFLVTFEDAKIDDRTPLKISVEQNPDEVQQLEYELIATREDLQSTIEELETSNEELKASNEEVMSMNEELQSSNEELESSKEELQSLNEEMTTVNNQLQDRVNDLESANSDIANLLNSTNVATLFLDRKLRVRRYTPAATRLFRLIPGDIGRSLEDIKLRYHDGDLFAQAHQVLTSLQPFEETVHSDEGGSFLYRMQPYRTLDDRIDGLVLTFVDITEIKRMEAELQASENRFRSFMDHSPAISWIKDSDGHYVFLSKTYEQRLKVTPALLQGKSDADFWPADVAAQFQQHDQAVLKQGKALEFEEFTRDKNGLQQYWRSFKFLIDNPAGAPFVAGVAVDITAQKHFQQMLAEKDQMLAHANHLARLGYWRWDLENDQHQWSEDIYEFYGRDPMLPPASYPEVKQYFTPESWQKLEQAVEQCLKDGSAYECDAEVIRADGEHRWITARGVCVKDASGHITGLHGTAQDITERKQAELDLQASEARFQALIEGTEDAVFIKDVEGCYRLFNSAAARFVGKTAEQLYGLTDRDLFPAAEAEQVMALDRQIIEQGESLTMEEVGTTADGITRTFLSSKGPVRLPSGELLGTYGIAKDITQLKQAESHRTSQLVADKESAESANRAKSEFLANMSHEIRTPLNAVLGMARIGRRESGETESQKLFEHILQAGDHLLGVINDILEFSRINAGKIEIHPEAMQLQELIDRCIAFVAEEANLKNLRFEFSGAQQMPKWVNGDSQRLRQILTNLLSNAVKFTASGRIRFNHRLHADEHHFSICDSGIGLSAEDIGRLFAPFEMADKSLTRSNGGSGLGLAISQRLAHLMGGRIEVASKPGEGSCFTLVVKLTSVPAPEITEGTQGPLSSLEGMRLLVAEDSEMNRLVLQDMLLEADAKVEFVINGQAAIDAIKADLDGFDAVIMDVQMPVLNGYDATRAIKQLRPELPVIGLTAHALPEEQQKGLAAGMSSYINKPIESAQQLIAVIAAAASTQQGSAQRGQTKSHRHAVDIIDWVLLNKKYRKTEVIDQLIKMACENAEKTLLILQNLKLPEDAQALSETLHSLTGDASILCSNAIVEKGLRLHQALQEEDANLAALLQEMSKLLERWLDELRSH